MTELCSKLSALLARGTWLQRAECFQPPQTITVTCTLLAVAFISPEAQAGQPGRIAVPEQGDGSPGLGRELRLCQNISEGSTDGSTGAGTVPSLSLPALSPWTLQLSLCCHHCSAPKLLNTLKVSKKRFSVIG